MELLYLHIDLKYVPNLKIYDFEVAGIALNGGVNSILNYRHIQLEDADGAQDFGKEVFLR